MSARMRRWQDQLTSDVDASVRMHCRAARSLHRSPHASVRTKQLHCACLPCTVALLDLLLKADRTSRREKKKKKTNKQQLLGPNATSYDRKDLMSGLNETTSIEWRCWIARRSSMEFPRAFVLFAPMSTPRCGCIQV